MFEGIYSKKISRKLSTGSKIRLIRTRKKLSSTELGAKCNITDSTVRYYEGDKRVLKEDKLQEIANALGVDVAALYDRKIESISDIMHILFEMEEAGYILPASISSETSQSREFFGIKSLNEALSEAIGLWKEKRDLWETEKLSADDYQNWKDAFPLQYASEMAASSQPEKAIYTESVTESVLDSKADLATSLRKKDSLLFRSLESRFVVLTYITEIPEELQKRICRYVNCSASFLTDRNCLEYSPADAFSEDVLEDKDILFDILDLMDKHPYTEFDRTIQIQLSRIVLYHLAQNGIHREQLREKQLLQGKIDYLYTGIKPLFKNTMYGLFYSDLAFIRELTGLSYQEMFTGFKL